MDISFDPAKRLRTIQARGLDFLDAPRIFAAPHFNIRDDRRDYGEERWVSFGILDGRTVAVVWTDRLYGRRIISMRHVHDDELEARRKAMD